LSRLLRA